MSDTSQLIVGQSSSPLHTVVPIPHSYSCTCSFSPEAPIPFTRREAPPFWQSSAMRAIIRRKDVDGRIHPSPRYQIQIGGFWAESAFWVSRILFLVLPSCTPLSQIIISFPPSTTMPPVTRPKSLSRISRDRQLSSCSFDGSLDSEGSRNAELATSPVEATCEDSCSSHTKQREPCQAWLLLPLLSFAVSWTQQKRHLSLRLGDC